MSSIGRRQRVLMTSRARELGTCKVKYNASSCPLNEGASISSAPKLGALVRLADCSHALHTASIGSISSRSRVVNQIVEELAIFINITPAWQLRLLSPRPVILSAAKDLARFYISTKATHSIST